MKKGCGLTILTTRLIKVNDLLMAAVLFLFLVKRYEKAPISTGNDDCDYIAYSGFSILLDN